MTSSAEFHAETSRAVENGDVLALSCALEWAAEERRKLVRIEDIARAFLDCFLSSQAGPGGAPGKEEAAALDAAWARWTKAPGLSE